MDHNYHVPIEKGKTAQDFRSATKVKQKEAALPIPLNPTTVRQSSHTALVGNWFFFPSSPHSVTTHLTYHQQLKLYSIKLIKHNINIS